MKMIIAILMLSASIRLNAQTVADVGQYVPLAATVGLGFCNVEARHCLRERVALTATSFAALTAVAGGLKLIVSERRPDDSDNRSFPSGHSARAFAGAELVRSEYGWGWALLSLPEQLLGREACRCDRTPEESLEFLVDHITKLTDGSAIRKQVMKVLK